MAELRIFVTTEGTEQCLIGDEYPIPQENIGDLILNAFKTKPDFIGQIDAETEEQITFEQMRENSVKCALWLKKEGVQKGSVVTICTRNPSIAYVPFLASIYIGAIVNPWDEKYFEDTIRVMYFLLINKPDVIFVDNDNFVKLIANILLLKDFDKIIKIVIIGEDKLPSVKLNSLESILNYNFDKAEIDEFSCEKNDLMEIAIMTFCSRAMFYSGRAKVPYVAFISPSNQQTPVMFSDTVGLWYGSLYWNHGPLLTVRAILSYVTVIKSRVFSEENLYKTIEKYKVTWVFLSETFNQLFKTNDVSFSKYNISSLKEFLFDDWEVEIFVLKKFISSLPNVSIIRVYGTAETGVIAYQTDNFSRRFKGRVTKNVQLLFVAKKNYPNIHPKLKFIYCKTPHISNTHVSTESAVHLWYSIGDVGFHIKDEIYVIDHYRHFYTYKNKPVRFLRSEIALRLHPAVSDVVVIAVPNDDHLVAYVNKISGKKVTKEQLKRILQKLPELHQLFPIDDFRFITHDFPRLPNGKIDRTRIHMLN